MSKGASALFPFGDHESRANFEVSLLDKHTRSWKIGERKHISIDAYYYGQTTYMENQKHVSVFELKKIE